MNIITILLTYTIIYYFMAPFEKIMNPILFKVILGLVLVILALKVLNIFFYYIKIKGD